MILHTSLALTGLLIVCFSNILEAYSESKEFVASVTIKDGAITLQLIFIGATSLANTLVISVMALLERVYTDDPGS
jgi:hypothetical protein